MKTYTTKEIANAVGVHPNTVRAYEVWGYISVASRKPNNYRIFTEKHLDEMRLARMAFPGPYPVTSKPLYKMIEAYIAEDFPLALKQAQIYYDLVKEEQTKSQLALRTLDQWMKGKSCTEQIIATGRIEFAQRLNVTTETIRNWERTGLFEPCINNKRYKKYSAFDFEKVQIIGLLRKAGFSIASLYKMFHSDEGRKDPAYFLETIYTNTETVHKAGEWMEHLKTHILRSQNIIQHIQEKI